MSEAPRLKTKYNSEILAALESEFNHTNRHTVAGLEKIVVNMGVGEAARDSKEAGYPIYTIAYGTANGYVISNGRREPVPVNPAELATVSRESGGEAFRAGSANELERVYSSIASSVGYEQVDQEVTELYAGIALAFAVLASLAVGSLAARWP